MKTVFVLFDSLNRHMLGPYGGKRIPTPNFDRLAQRSVTFDRHYVGSLPCIPARRDMLTGRLSFLHRSWGPMEPFDNAFPELLYHAGVYSHLITDHYHYWEDGGATYHNRYDSYEFVRGQEGDPWKAMVQPPWERLREMYHERQFDTAQRNYFRHNMVNREFIREESEFPSVQVFARGFEFLEQNRDADNWLLQIETFDPHEPFYAPARFKKPFETGWNGPVRDWPRYGRVDELPAECEELRANYYAVVSMCDFLLGQLLDDFDRHDMWKDTALVVTTDHGFLLGEHDFWAKNRMNLYEELVHIPLFMHDPRAPELAGTRSAALTQTIDVAPTFLDLHGVEPPAENEGLLAAQDAHRRLRARGGALRLFRRRGERHRRPLHLPPLPGRPQHPGDLPVHGDAHPHLGFLPARGTGGGDALGAVPLHQGRQAAQGAGRASARRCTTPTAPAPCSRTTPASTTSTSDPGQEKPLADAAVEARMVDLMAGLMRANHAPPEAFTRLGLTPDGAPIPGAPAKTVA